MCQGNDPNCRDFDPHMRGFAADMAGQRRTFSTSGFFAAGGGDSAAINRLIHQARDGSIVNRGTQGHKAVVPTENDAIIQKNVFAGDA